MVRVSVQLSQALAQTVGWRQQEVVLQGAPTVRDLLVELRSRQPEFAGQIPADPVSDLPHFLLVVVNGWEARPDLPLREGDGVTLLLPISGG